MPHYSVHENETLIYRQQYFFLNKTYLHIIGTQSQGSLYFMLSPHGK